MYTYNVAAVEISASCVSCRPPQKKFEDKVFIPQDDHPETNFVGLLIGPRLATMYTVHVLYMYMPYATLYMYI